MTADTKRVLKGAHIRKRPIIGQFPPHVEIFNTHSREGKIFLPFKIVISS
jgi:hypothetical protein